MRPPCRVCGQPGRHVNNHNGKRYYSTLCAGCHKRRLLYKTTTKGDRCQHCGFVPVHPCQLDLDHVDGDNRNNAPENLMTLCANCHRLKTHRNKDFNGWRYPPDSR